MGDRTWTHIQFSGKLNRELAPLLIKELNEQGCYSDYDSNSDVGERDLSSGFYDESCNYATMNGIESFCKEHGVSYLKKWDSGGSYGPGYQLYNAIVDQTFEVPGDDEPCLGLNELAQFAKDGKTLQDVVVYLQIIKDFDKHYPPLELVD